RVIDDVGLRPGRRLILPVEPLHLFRGWLGQQDRPGLAGRRLILPVEPLRLFRGWLGQQDQPGLAGHLLRPAVRAAAPLPDRLVGFPPCLLFGGVVVAAVIAQPHAQQQDAAGPDHRADADGYCDLCAVQLSASLICRIIPGRSLAYPASISSPTSSGSGTIAMTACGVDSPTPSGQYATTGS